MLSELIFFKGLGKPACGNWGAEDSFLVLGMDQAASMKLGRHFEQNAIVFSEYDAIPKLLLLR